MEKMINSETEWAARCHKVLRRSGPFVCISLIAFSFILSLLSSLFEPSFCHFGFSATIGVAFGALLSLANLEWLWHSSIGSIAHHFNPFKLVVGIVISLLGIVLLPLFAFLIVRSLLDFQVLLFASLGLGIGFSLVPLILGLALSVHFAPS